MEDESSDRHAHAGKHLHMGIATRFVMFTAGGTDAYGCTSKGQQGLVFIILKEKTVFQDMSRETSHTHRVRHHDL